MARRIHSFAVLSLILLVIIYACSHPERYRSESQEGLRDRAEAQDEKPILVIETGGHQSGIKDLVFSNDNRFLISASMDKTIRVWDVQTGRPSRVIRGQIGRGLSGSIYDLALSPDDQWMAVAGMLTECT